MKRWRASSPTQSQTIFVSWTRNVSETHRRRGRRTRVEPLVGVRPRRSPRPATGTAGATYGPETFKLPDLGFAKDALAPGIDPETMDIHHGKHHAGYVRKLNAALDGTMSSRTEA